MYAATIIFAMSITPVAGAPTDNQCTWYEPMPVEFTPATSKVLSPKAVESLAKQWNSIDVATKMAKSEFSLRDLVKRFGPAAHDYGSGVFILEWKMADGRVFRASAGRPCDVPTLISISKVPT
jgi:hypothetical protein